MVMGGDGVGEFQIYGLLIGVAITVGFWLAERARKKMAAEEIKLTKFSVWEAWGWVVVLGLVGARLYHVAGLWSYYRLNPVETLAIWQGGLGIYGAIGGGLGGLWIFAVKNKISWLRLADLAALALPAGQALGRLGNYFNRELFGLPTDLPWGIYIDFMRRPEAFKDREYFQPLFLYELLFNFLVWLILSFRLRKKGARAKPGSYFSLYLVMYGTGRFFLEYLRIEKWWWRDWEINQLVSLAAVIIGFALFQLQVRPAKKIGGAVQ